MILQNRKGNTPQMFKSILVLAALAIMTNSQLCTTFEKSKCITCIKDYYLYNGECYRIVDNAQNIEDILILQDTNKRKFTIFPSLKDNQISNLFFYDEVNQKNAITQNQVRPVPTNSIASFYQITQDKKQQGSGVNKTLDQLLASLQLIKINQQQKNNLTQTPQIKEKEIIIEAPVKPIQEPVTVVIVQQPQPKKQEGNILFQIVKETSGGIIMTSQRPDYRLELIVRTKINLQSLTFMGRMKEGSADKKRTRQCNNNYTLFAYERLFTKIAYEKAYKDFIISAIQSIYENLINAYHDQYETLSADDICLDQEFYCIYSQLLKKHKNINKMSILKVEANHCLYNIDYKIYLIDDSQLPVVIIYESHVRINLLNKIGYELSFSEYKTINILNAI